MSLNSTWPNAKMIGETTVDIALGSKSTFNAKELKESSTTERLKYKYNMKVTVITKASKMSMAMHMAMEQS